MKLPYRPRLLPIARRHFRYIIIHDMSCQFSKLNEFLNDSTKFQTNKLRSVNFVTHGMYDLNYHFIVEKIHDDYETIVGRPLYALCEYEDIKSPYDVSIHIGLIGDFTFEKPDNRYYQQLAYRSITPMMRAYRIPPSNVLLHKDISDSSDPSNMDCPGNLFNMTLLQSFIASWKVSN